MNKSILFISAAFTLVTSGSYAADIKIFDRQVVFGTFVPVNLDDRDTFDQLVAGKEGVKDVVLTCFPGDTAEIFTNDARVGGPATGVIVDNFLTINDDTGIDPVRNVCDLGDVAGNTGCVGTECYPGFSNCFVTGATSPTGGRIEETFTGIGTISVPVGGDPLSDVIPLGTNSNTFYMWDWGAVAGNTELRLDTSCLEGDVPLDAKPGSNPNSVNLCKEGGVVPVAFPGSDSIDYTQYTIVGVSLTGDPANLIAGKGKSDVCKLEDVVDGSDPSDITPDGHMDVVCHIPTVDFADAAETTDSTITAYLVLSDGFDEFVVSGTSDLNIVRTCD